MHLSCDLWTSLLSNTTYYPFRLLEPSNVARCSSMRLWDSQNLNRTRLALFLGHLRCPFIKYLAKSVYNGLILLCACLAMLQNVSWSFALAVGSSSFPDIGNVSGANLVPCTNVWRWHGQK